MKKLFSCFCLLSLILLITPNNFLGQQKPRQEVTVTAVEVPVRVFVNGQFLKNLTKNDFEIFENGVKQEITNFEVISRKIALPTGEGREQLKKRLFILIFNVFDYNDAVGEGIDYFFQNFFQKNDQFVIVVENQTLNIERGKNLNDVILSLKDALKKFKLISNQATLKNFRDLNYEADRLLAAFRGEMGQTPLYNSMIKFFENYQRIWNDYRKQYLIPDIGSYEAILRRIKMMEGEKWAICFQQREMFPKLKHESPLDRQISDWIGSQVDPEDQVWARLVQARQTDLRRAFDLSEDFPEKSMVDLFMNANVCFHLILLKSFREISSQDFELKEVSQDYEKTLKRISSSTGGSSLFSNDVTHALEEVIEKEDYYYLLVYSPQESQTKKKTEIEVKVNHPDAKVVYLKKFPGKMTPPITITNFKSGRQTIAFAITNLTRQKIEDKLQGLVDVKITLFDKDSKKVFDEGKSLSMAKEEVKISLNLPQLERGRYFIILEVTDRISGEKDIFSGEIEL